MTHQRTGPTTPPVATGHILGPTHADILDQATTMPTSSVLLQSTHAFDGLTEAPAVLFTGCGASFHAASGAARLLSSLGGTGTAAPASEVWLSPQTYLRPGTVLVALSRTGTTTEVVRAVGLARDQGLATIGITLTDDSPVVTQADSAIVLSHALERGRVMTQSFANLLLAAQAAALVAAGTAPQVHAQAVGLASAVDALAGQLPGMDSAAREQAARGARHYVFLGSGPVAPICAQGVLMMQEMTQLPSESYPGLEYRHGPIAALGNESLLVVIATEESLQFDVVLAGDALTLGHQPLVIGGATTLAKMPHGVATLEIADHLPSAAVATMALPYLQLLACHRTRGLGLDPESVRNLDRTQQIHVNPHVVDVDLGVGPRGE